jgi:hypothetical protein
VLPDSGTAWKLETNMNWETVETRQLTRDLLIGLFRNEIGAIRIPNFLSDATCSAAVGGVYRRGLDYYKDVYPRIGRIGITQFEHRGDAARKAEYFEKVPKAHAVRQEVFKESGDLPYLVIQALRDAWGDNVDMATEDGPEQRYFAGLIRVINKALLHLDWAQLDAPDWSIGKISAQLAWNVYLQMGARGGETVVYRRPWQWEDEDHQVPNSYGYDPILVEGCEKATILPARGDLVLFNSRNFHEVEATEGEIERVTNSSFIGWLEAENRLVLWS